MDESLVQVEDDSLLDVGGTEARELDLAGFELRFDHRWEGLDVLERLQGLNQMISMQFRALEVLYCVLHLLLICGLNLILKLTFVFLTRAFSPSSFRLVVLLFMPFMIVRVRQPCLCIEFRLVFISLSGARGLLELVHLGHQIIDRVMRVLLLLLSHLTTLSIVLITVINCSCISRTCLFLLFKVAPGALFPWLNFFLLLIITTTVRLLTPDLYRGRYSSLFSYNCSLIVVV